MAAPVRIRRPKKPQGHRTFTPAVSPADDLDDEKTLRALIYQGSDFAGRSVYGCDVEESRLEAVRLGDVELDQVIISDTVLERSDLANARCRGVSLLQVLLDACRLTGSSWSDGLFRDVTLTDCRADLTRFRQGKLRSVAFTDCNLRGADFQWAEFSHVEFTRCDLSAAQFANARMSGVMFTDCTLDGVGGVTGLRGATVQARDLIGLAPSLAHELGIGIED
ncbi:pentapeptide repeat-containing protein [Kineosporia sp. J2-2]|uniref:Pentapeptide repeat-containing protein n=1 Tax=Kineosporia corallincola TaxID=2835133 RepID=A0ABS5TIS2_9ACTN|nr:pentapeptide repeat-containing protein [Kineosporia corallincola]MBT0770111.1 pentapeptide repeat-containing protein [Kineosporia corallincola]